MNIRILEANAIAQKNLVDKINQQIQTQMGLLATNERSVQAAVQGLASTQQQQGIFNSVKRIFDPSASPAARTAAPSTGAGHGGLLASGAGSRGARTGETDGAARSRHHRAAVGGGQVVDGREGTLRLRGGDRSAARARQGECPVLHAGHLQEPPDQRFFRLYDIDVPIVMPVTNGVTVDVAAADDGRTMPSGLRAVLGKDDAVVSRLPMPDVTVTRKKLVDVADLDNVLAYKGNYMVFALKENNYITLHMMQDYLDVGEELQLRDPDELGNYSIEKLQNWRRPCWRKPPTPRRRRRAGKRSSRC